MFGHRPGKGSSQHYLFFFAEVPAQVGRTRGSASASARTDRKERFFFKKKKKKKKMEAPSAAAVCKDDEAALKTNIKILKCADVRGFCTDKTHGPNARKYCPKTCDSCPTAPLSAAPSAAVVCKDDEAALKTNMGQSKCADVKLFCTEYP